MGTVDKYINMIEKKSKGEPWTEKEIIYFRKYINTTQSTFLVNEFYNKMPDKGYLIFKDHSDKGTNYLLDKSIKKNGKFRKGSKLGEREISVLKNNPINYLIGLKPLGPTYYVAVYQATDTEGNSFKYTGVTYTILEVVK